MAREYGEMAEKFRALRERTGLTQADFAKGMGISYKTYIHWEYGQNTPASYIYDLIEMKLKNNNYHIDVPKNNRDENELMQVDVRLKLVEGPSLFSEESIRNEEDAVRIMSDVMAELDREEVCVVNLDSGGRPINYNVVSVGDINSSELSVRNVFKASVLSNSSGIILLHNHPSGLASHVSKEDKLVTQKMMYASTFMDIPMYDHIIVGGRTGECYSLKAHMPELFDAKVYMRTLERVADGGATTFTRTVNETNVGYEAGNVPGETEIINQEEQVYGIYQLKPGIFDGPDGHRTSYQFMGMDFVKNSGLEVLASDYNLGYTDKLPPGESLESIYRRFNMNRPDDFRGHSLSVSDVIVVENGLGPKAYYVDSFGFTELLDFVKQREMIMDGKVPDDSPFVEETETIQIGGEKDESKAKTKEQKENTSTPKKTRKEQIQEISEKLEKGLEELFDSDKYRDYLKCMSKFSSYSFNNSLLIALQKPEASLVAGYQAWQKNFGRQVKKGAKAIRIIAPAPFKKKEEQQVRDEHGNFKTEEVEVTIPAFKAVPVFDVSDTYGDPLPTIGAEELLQSVDGFDDFMKAVAEIAPVPIRYDEIKGGAKGYFSHSDQEIVINKGMSQSQTLKTAVHELAHALLHDVNEKTLTDEQRVEIDLLHGEVSTNMGSIPVIDYLDMEAAKAGYDDFESFSRDGYSVSGYESITAETMELDRALQASEEDRKTKEVQAESVAFVCLTRFGLEAELVGEYSFGYIAGWSSGKELTELKSSMETIQKTADKIISGIEEKMHEYRKERLPEQSQTQENVDELYQKMDVKNADSYTKVSEAAVAYEVTSEGYNWPGMQKLSMEELEQYAKEPEGFIGLYMLYPDCTEAQIIEPMTMDEIKDALSRGIEFGDELPKRIEAVNDTGYRLPYTDPYSGEPMEVTLELSSYLNNGQIYLGLVQMDEVYGPEPYGEITVNLGWPCPFYCSYIDTNNFSNVEDFIVSNGLGVFTGLTQKSGFCEYPLYQFFPEKLRELEPRELAQYERINKIPAEHQKSNETLQEKMQEQEHEHQHELEQKKKR